MEGRLVRGRDGGVEEEMEGWMEGLRKGWRDGMKWRNEEREGWKAEQRDEWKAGWTDRCMLWLSPHQGMAGWRSWCGPCCRPRLPQQPQVC